MRGCLLLLGLLSSFTSALDPHWKRLHYNTDLCPDNLGVGPTCAVRPLSFLYPLAQCLGEYSRAQLLSFAAGI